MITLQGFPQLDKRFNQLAAVAKREALAKAVKAGAVIVRDDAAARAPRRTGALAAHMTTKVSADTDISEARAFIGPGKKEFYGHFQEFGTGTFFEAAAARALGYPGRSRSTKRNGRAQPFLRPALESTGPAAIREIERRLEMEIRKAETA